MIPTDEQLNDAMAEAMGYTIRRGVMTYDGMNSPWRVWKKDGPESINPKPFCADRNLLPEVWEAVCLCFRSYLYELTLLACGMLAPGYAERDPFGWWEDTATMPPRLHVTAALKARGHWPDDWQI